MSGVLKTLRRRPFSSLALLIFLALAALIWPYREALQAFPGIISAYSAKEYCSCRYVMNQPADACRTYVKQWLPSALNDDPATRHVIATGLGRTSTAAWQGERQGCRLLPQAP